MAKALGGVPIQPGAFALDIDNLLLATKCQQAELLTPDTSFRKKGCLNRLKVEEVVLVLLINGIALPALLTFPY
jgi:hypothetical protein